MSAGKHREGYRRPRTGEKRKTRQPFAIDKLPQETRDQILALRAAGKTWDDIAETVKLPRTTVHRWYDVRVEQASIEAKAEAAQARELAEIFVKNGFEKLPEAVQNALASKVFALLHARDVDAQIKALKGLGYFVLQVQHGQQEQQRLEMEAAKQKPAAEGKKKLNAEELRRKLDEIYGIEAA